ncbi:MAG: signal peptide peptidase SppA [Alphaproteobacteria bacterium GM7ARS4]|nr:signal peptide peptidase SppA [Alphaproteobacteria bacterium GM7ARS4]
MKGILKAFPRHIVTHVQEAQRKTRWRVIAFFALLCAIILSSFIRDGASFAPYIARLHIEGFIENDQQRLHAIEFLKEDRWAQGLIVYINSPGGTLVGGEALYRSLKALNDNHIPVVVVMGELATSAAYMTSLAAERIFAYEGTITGSIGVILQTVNILELLKNIGISTETFKSGDLKAVPNPFEPIDDKTRTATNKIIEQSRLFFFDLVRQHRQLDEDTLTSLKDGRILLGAQAIEKNLVDALGGEQDARTWLIDTHALDPLIHVHDITYGEEHFFPPLPWHNTHMTWTTWVQTALMMLLKGQRSEISALNPPLHRLLHQQQGLFALWVSP